MAAAVACLVCRRCRRTWHVAVCGGRHLATTIRPTAVPGSWQLRAVVLVKFKLYANWASTGSQSACCPYLAGRPGAMPWYHRASPPMVEFLHGEYLQVLCLSAVACKAAARGQWDFRDSTAFWFDSRHTAVDNTGVLVDHVGCTPRVYEYICILKRRDCVLCVHSSQGSGKNSGRRDRIATPHRNLIGTYASWLTGSEVKRRGHRQGHWRSHVCIQGYSDWPWWVMTTYTFQSQVDITVHFIAM